MKAGPKPISTERDWLSHAGAVELTARLRAHWAAEGHDVTFWVEPAKPNWRSKGSHGLEWFAIRSDLLGGLPQSTTKRISSRPRGKASV